MTIPAEAVALDVQPAGKLEVRGVGPESSLCFNLSHPGDLALMAVSRTREIQLFDDPAHRSRAVTGVLVSGRARCVS